MTVAFFYRNPVALDREQHRNVRLLPITSASFAAQSAAVPLVAAEFAEACLEYPIVFMKSGAGWVAVAVTGLAQDENLFVNDKGEWTGRYVPLSVRRYPFVLALRDDGQWCVSLDQDCEQVIDVMPNPAESSESPVGERLFDDAAEPSQAMRNTIQMLFEYQGQADATSALVQRLSDAKLLTEAQLQISLADGRKAALKGGWIVNEAELKNLLDTTVASWFRNGDLALVYTHLISLRNLAPLLSRRPV
jgi:SapC